MTILSIIVARASNGVIGKGNELPWHLPEDLAYFKRTTLGKPVIMGRKTWDSIVGRLGKALPGRRNMVLTHHSNWSASGAERVASLEEALILCSHVPEAFVIGGAQLYTQALEKADLIYLTQIDQAFEGDVYFPLPSAFQWEEISRQTQQSKDQPPLTFHWIKYQRKTSKKFQAVQ